MTAAGAAAVGNAATGVGVDDGVGSVGDGVVAGGGTPDLGLGFGATTGDAAGLGGRAGALAFGFDADTAKVCE